jgi:hypothetical protein
MHIIHPKKGFYVLDLHTNHWQKVNESGNSIFGDDSDYVVVSPNKITVHSPCESPRMVDSSQFISSARGESPMMSNVFKGSPRRVDKLTSSSNVFRGSPRREKKGNTSSRRGSFKKPYPLMKSISSLLVGTLNVNNIKL